MAIYNIRLRFLCAAFMALYPLAGPAHSTAVGEQRIDSLARDVERAEAVRTVKSIQRAYSQYAQYGLWDDMASLFSEGGELVWGDDDIKGRAAIAKYNRDKFGGGNAGLPAGVVNCLFVDVPLVNLSPDGLSAKARWYGFFMLGGGTNARWDSGTFENEYVKENGRWKISRMRYYPQFGGPYEKGWDFYSKPLPLIPYHFRNEAEAGTPIPPPTGVAPHTTDSLADLERRIERLNEEDKVRNLQNAYGYYIDRKMWDDVVDLFTTDGVLEIGGIGLYDGPENIRRALDRVGSAGLKYGELNDHPLFDTMIEIAPNGHEAHVRGLELGIIGDFGTGTARWTVNVFDNRFVKGDDEKWRIREMRLFPVVNTDYYQGWGKSHIVDPSPSRDFAPDRAIPVADSGDNVIPAFLPNPVTGKPAHYPTGTKVVAERSLLDSLRAAPLSPSTSNMEARLVEDERKLAVAKAYDGAMNITAAYTYYIDDGQWSSMGAIFAEHGNKQVPFNGYYIGPERIAHRPGAEPLPNSRNPGRGGWHWLLQPVIDVAPDGRSAKMRTRLFHPNAGFNPGGGIEGGMYPNNQAVLEKGAWKLWSVTIDEPYFSAAWPYGWAKPIPPRQFPAPRPSTGALPAIPGEVIYPPNVPEMVLGKRMEGFAGGTGETIKWPGILNMWFHYKNPVSGRLPEHYWPNCGVCVYAPYLSMDKYGYELPPS